MQPLGRSPRHGFTLLEIVVSMTVFGIALTGLFPLLVVLSRDLQPIKSVAEDGSIAYRSVTPARDGNVNGADFSPKPVYEQHVWYIWPYNDPWVRKLGASARLYSVEQNTTMPNDFQTSESPIPIEDVILNQDDYAVGDPNEDDGSFTAPDWIHEPSVPGAWRNDCHRIMGVPVGGPSVNVAEWIFSVDVTGWYDIHATWLGNIDNQVDDADFSVLVDAPTPSTGTFVLSINQQIDPDDITDLDGSKWQRITTAPVLLLEGNSVKVRLSDVRKMSDADDKYVVADGVRMVLLHNDVDIVSVERSRTIGNNNSNDANITAKVKVTVNIPE